MVHKGPCHIAIYEVILCDIVHILSAPPQAAQSGELVDALRKCGSAQVQVVGLSGAGGQVEGFGNFGMSSLNLGF